jgi:SAM-dependent methyltransferase
MTFEDHFSGHADAYVQHRPRYPQALFTWLASVIRGRTLAWDAGTGNGQVAIALTAHVGRVVATDASADQLAHATAHACVEYRNEPVERVSLSSGSVDLITAGAAAHWFDLDAFYREVGRVAKRGAVVALFSYGPRDIADALGPVVRRFEKEVLQGFWPERIQYVHDRYTSLPFPFEEVAAPKLEMSAQGNLAEVLAFLETWSGAQRYFEERGTRATDEIAAELAEEWGDPAWRREVRYPLFIRAGRV